ncbi:Ribonuclease 3 [compost metagenome]
MEYRIVDERGPAHEKQFLAEVWMDERLLGQGTGRSKKEAEQEAAAKALSQLGKGAGA